MASSAEILREKLEVVAKLANELRGAGVRRISLGDIEFELAEPPRAPRVVTEAERRQREEEELDANDPLRQLTNGFPGLDQMDRQ